MSNGLLAYLLRFNGDASGKPRQCVLQPSVNSLRPRPSKTAGCATQKAALVLTPNLLLESRGFESHESATSFLGG